MKLVEANKILKAAEEICISGKETLELTVMAIESGVTVSRSEGFDQDEKERLLDILKGVIQEYKKTD